MGGYFFDNKGIFISILKIFYKTIDIYFEKSNNKTSKRDIIKGFSL